MDKEFVSGLPLTEAERKRDEDEKREVLSRGFARKKARRSGQRYDTPATPAHRRAYDKVGGE